MGQSINPKIVAATATASLAGVLVWAATFFGVHIPEVAATQIAALASLAVGYWVSDAEYAQQTNQTRNAGGVPPEIRAQFASHPANLSAENDALTYQSHHVVAQGNLMQPQPKATNATSTPSVPLATNPAVY